MADLPSPVRAVLGLAALAVDEARRLPDRALELPMVAVSRALQLSLRAQQRYAELEARGDQVLSARAVTDEPPGWATFDDDLPGDAGGAGDAPRPPSAFDRVEEPGEHVLMARLDTSPDSPVPVRVIAMKINEWISRLGEVWIDGQIAQLNRRPGMATQFLVLRDPDANISLSVTCPRGILPEELSEGSRVVVRARPDFWLERGTLSMRASAVRQVGLGELLARLEQLKRLLAAEGLFAADRKRALPFLPRRIGLITGRASAAERDVVENARRRLPAAQFRIENVATQGVTAVNDIVAALERLDADPEVEVIVVARGGGSVEDLLPFSNESLVRAVSAARTPVVSAIGHDTDVPLLDHVADLAASTPTDAARRVVPDLADELRAITELRERARTAAQQRLGREADLMAGLPGRMRMVVRGRLARDHDETGQLRDRARRTVRAQLNAARAELDHAGAQVRALSPQATLDRGYAVVRRPDGTVIRDAAEALGALRIRVARGEFDATVP